MSKLYPDLSLTNFPNELDIFINYLDIVASDGVLVKQYVEAMNLGNLALATQILNQIPNATQKIIKATDLNKLTQALLAIERFYKSDISGYISNKQIEWEAIINQFDYKGVWSNGVSYLKNNMVSYVILGMEFIYIAIQNVPTGVSVTNEQYWRKLTVQGQQGVSGDGLSYRKQWIVSTFYTVNDAVTYNGGLWMAVKPSQGVEPTQSSDSWKLIMSLATTTYPIQDTQPTNQQAGDLWFDTRDNPTKYYYLETLKNEATPEDIAIGKECYNQFGEKIVGVKL